MLYRLVFVVAFALATWFAIATFTAVAQANQSHVSVPQYLAAPEQSKNVTLLRNSDGQVIREIADGAGERYIIELKQMSLTPYVNSSRQTHARQSSTAKFKADVADYRSRLQRQQRALEQQLLSRKMVSKVHYRSNSLVNTLVVSANKKDITSIAAMPGVKKVHPDRRLQLHLSESVPLIHADQVWSKQDSQGNFLTGQGVRVGVLDTGIDYTHPDLGGCFGQGCKVAGGYDFVDQDNDPMDVDGHGTHVAGIIAANGELTGVAPDATLYAYRVCKYYCSTSDILAALEMAVDPDGDPLTDDAMDIVNMSLGGSGSYDDILSTATNNAVQAGIVVVVSAGNDGPQSGTIGSPGAAEQAVTVASSDKYDQVSSFSSRGPGGSTAFLKPDIIAPGESIVSTHLEHGSQYLSGTSMAAPHVAGSAALLMQKHPDATAVEIKSMLTNTARSLGIAGLAQGAGRLDSMAAITAGLSFSPVSLSFDRVDLNAEVWRATRTVKIENHQPETVTLDLRLAELPEGISVEIAEGDTLDMQPGQTLEVNLDVEVDNRIYGFPENNEIAEEGVLIVNDQSQEYRLPFVLFKHVELGLTTEEYIARLDIYSADGSYQRTIEGAQSETLMLPPGTYNVIAYFDDWDGKYWLAKENIEVSQDKSFTLDKHQAKHKFLINGFNDANGVAAALDRLDGGAVFVELRNTKTRVLRSYDFDPIGLTNEYPLYFSDMSEDIQVGFSGYWQDSASDLPQADIYVLSERLQGVSQGKAYQIDGSEFSLMDISYTDIPGLSDGIKPTFGLRWEPGDLDLVPGGWYTSGRGMVLYSLGEWQHNPFFIRIFGNKQTLEPFAGTGGFYVNFERNLSEYNYVSAGDRIKFTETGQFTQVNSSYGLNGGKFTEYPRAISHSPVWRHDNQSLYIRDFFGNIYDNTLYFNLRHSDIFSSESYNHTSLLDFTRSVKCDGVLTEENVEMPEEFSELSITCDNYEMQLEYSNRLWGEVSRSLYTAHFSKNDSISLPSIQRFAVLQGDEITHYPSAEGSRLELAAPYTKRLSLEINYQGHWESLPLSDVDKGPYRSPYHSTLLPMPTLGALASLRIRAEAEDGNRIENIIHNALVIGKEQSGIKKMDGDGDAIPDYMDEDDDNDGLPDLYELQFGLNHLQANGEQDADGDGLTNMQEYELASDPGNPDSDGDGLPDGWEVQHGFNPLDAADGEQDTDGDGLSNAEEYELGTDYNDSDSDDDGLPDGWEVTYGLDPINTADSEQDADDDGLTNMQEYELASDPGNPDSDGDGLPDGWEVEYGLDLLAPSDASSDTDSDGYTALQEYQNGTSPNQHDAQPSASANPSSAGSTGQTNSGGGAPGSLSLAILFIALVRRFYQRDLPA